MILPVLLLVQMVGPPDPGRPSPPRPQPLNTGCGAPGRDGEILVCGRADVQESYRLRPLDRSMEAPRLKAETTLIGKVKAAAETEASGVGGRPSKRLMMRLKAPL